MPIPSEALRSERLEQAGFNVLNLDPEDIAIDLLTDVPPRALVASTLDAGLRAARAGEREPDLQALAAQLYGDFAYVVSTKGRAAEVLLADGLGKRSPTVVTTGLFFTTQLALATVGARIETAPRRADDTRTSDPDPAWLEQRLAAGGVDIVYLEACNNALGGTPLTHSALEAASHACRRHGALLVLDAARLLANGLALGGPACEVARSLTALADAFTVSCSKELLVPMGALVAVRSAALRDKLVGSAYGRGMLLEPLEARVQLAAGIADMAQRADAVLGARRALLHRLASALRARGIAPLEPIEGHAVYVPVPSELLEASPTRARALEGLLYRFGGVRTVLFPYPLLGRALLRLTLPLALYGEAEMEQTAEAVQLMLQRADEAPRLLPDPEQRHPLIARYPLERA